MNQANRKFRVTAISAMVVGSLLGGMLPAYAVDPEPTQPSLTGNQLMDSSSSDSEVDDQALGAGQIQPAIIAHLNLDDSNIRQGSNSRRLGLQFEKAPHDATTSITRRYEVVLKAPAGIKLDKGSGSGWTCKAAGNGQRCVTDRDREYGNKSAPSALTANVEVQANAALGSTELMASVNYEQLDRPIKESKAKDSEPVWRTVKDPAPDQATARISVTPAFGMELVSLVGKDYVAPAQGDGEVGFSANFTHTDDHGVAVRWQQVDGPKLALSGGSQWQQAHVTKKSTLSLKVPAGLKLDGGGKRVTFEVTAQDDGVKKTARTTVLIERAKPVADVQQKVLERSSQQGEAEAQGYEQPQGQPSSQQGQDQSKGTPQPQVTGQGSGQKPGQNSGQGAGQNGGQQQDQPIEQHQQELRENAEDQAQLWKSVLGSGVDHEDIDHVLGQKKPAVENPAAGEQKQGENAGSGEQKEKANPEAGDKQGENAQANPDANAEAQSLELQVDPNSPALIATPSLRQLCTIANRLVNRGESEPIDIAGDVKLTLSTKRAGKLDAQACKKKQDAELDKTETDKQNRDVEVEKAKLAVADRSIADLTKQITDLKLEIDTISRLGMNQGRLPELNQRLTKAEADLQAAQKTSTDTQTKLDELGKKPVPQAAGGVARLQPAANVIEFDRATLDFAGINFNEIKGKIDFDARKISLNTLFLDPKANESSWVAKTISNLSQVNTKDLAVTFSDSAAPAMDGTGTLNLRGVLGTASTVVNGFLDVIGVKNENIPFLNGQGGSLNDFNSVQFSFNKQADPLVVDEAWPDPKNPAKARPGKAILGMSFVMGDPAKASKNNSGSVLVSGAFRDMADESNFVAGDVQVYNFGPISLGDSAGLISGTIRAGWDGATQAYRKRLANEAVNAQQKIDAAAAELAQLMESEQPSDKEAKQIAAKLKEISSLKATRDKAEKQQQEDKKWSWSGSLGLKCTATQSSTERVLKPDTGEDAGQYIAEVLEYEKQLNSQSICALTDSVGLKDAQVAYAQARPDKEPGKKDADKRAAEAYKADSGLTLGATLVFWKQDQTQSATTTNNCSATAMVENMAKNAEAAKKIGCREITLSTKGQLNFADKQLRLDVGLSGTDRKSANAPKAATLEEGQTTRDLVPAKTSERDEIIDIGWDMKLTSVNGKLEVRWGDAVANEPIWKRIRVDVGGEVKGAFSEYGKATARIGNVCEAADAKAGKCRVGSLHVEVKVDVPFAPLGELGAAGGGTASEPTKRITAEGILDWGSQRFTIKGSYGNGTAALDGGFALRDLGVTLTNDPTEKPTVCVTDEEAQKRLDNKPVSQAELVVQVKKEELAAAQAKLKELQKKKPVDQAAVDAAQVKIDAAQQALDQANAELDQTSAKNEAMLKEKEELAKQNHVWVGLSGTALISGMQLDVQGRYVPRDKQVCMAIQGTDRLSYNATSGQWEQYDESKDNAADAADGNGNFGVRNWSVVYANFPVVIQRPVMETGALDKGLATSPSPTPSGTTSSASASATPASPVQQKVVYENVKLGKGLTVMGRVPVTQLLPDAVSSGFDKSQFVDVSAFLGTTDSLGFGLTVSAKFNLLRKSYLVGAASVERNQNTLAFVGFDGKITLASGGMDVHFNGNSELSSPIINAEGKPDATKEPSRRQLVTGVKATAAWSGPRKGFSVSLSAALQAMPATKNADGTTQAVTARSDFGIPDFWIGHGSLAATFGGAGPILTIDLQDVHLPNKWTSELSLKDSTISATLVIASTGGGFSFRTKPLANLPASKRGDQFDLLGLGWIKASEIGLSVVTVPYSLPDPNDASKMIDYPAGFGVIFDGEILGTPLRLNVSYGMSANGMKLCTDIRIPRINVAGGLVLSGYNNRYDYPSAAKTDFTPSSSWSCDGKQAPPAPPEPQVPGVTPMPVASPMPTAEPGQNPILVRLDIDTAAGRYNAEMDASISLGWKSTVQLGAGLKGKLRTGKNSDAAGKALGTAIDLRGGGSLSLATYDMAKVRFAVDVEEKAGALFGNIRFNAEVQLLMIGLGVGGAVVLDNGEVVAVGVRGMGRFLFWNGYGNLTWCPGTVRSIEYSEDMDSAPIPRCSGNSGMSLKAWLGHKNTDYPETQTYTGLNKLNVPVADGPDVLEPDWALNGKGNRGDINDNTRYMTTGQLDEKQVWKECKRVWGFLWESCDSDEELLAYRMSLGTRLTNQKRPEWMWPRDYERLTETEAEVPAAPATIDGTANPEMLSERPLAQNNPCVAMPSVYTNSDKKVALRELRLAPRGAFRKDLSQQPSCTAFIYAAVKNHGRSQNWKLATRGWSAIKPGIVTCRGNSYGSCEIKFYDNEANGFRQLKTLSGVLPISQADVDEINRMKQITGT